MLVLVASACTLKQNGPPRFGGSAYPFLPNRLFPHASIQVDGGRHATAVSPGRLDPMKTNDEAHWADTSRLMWITLGLWFFFGYVIHMFVHVLNKITIFGFPLGFYMAAQGSLIAFVAILFWFARAQDQIDRKHGVAEDE
jgi:putative solute:sodium symporter small subunit